MLTDGVPLHVASETDCAAPRPVVETAAVAGRRSLGDGHPVLPDGHTEPAAITQLGPEPGHGVERRQDGA